MVTHQTPSCLLLFLYINMCIYMNACACTHTHTHFFSICRSKIILLCYCIEEMAVALGLGDGLGALAAAWELLGGGDLAAAGELSLPLLLLAGMLLVPLLEQSADGALSGRHPSQPAPHLPQPEEPPPCPGAHSGQREPASLRTPLGLLGILHVAQTEKNYREIFPLLEVCKPPYKYSPWHISSL